MSEKCSGSWIKWLLVGTVLGMVFIACSATAMRYTDSRPFCGSCHVMSDAVFAHNNSSHANLTCNECHAPSNLVSKIPYKAKVGIYDIVSNTMGNDVPVRANMASRDIINDNCISCHIVTNKQIDVMAVKPYCTDCHKTMKHTTKKPISTRMVADD